MPSSIEEHHLLAFNTACRKGHRADAEDFAQDYALKQLEGSKQPAKFALIDWLRATYGETRTDNGRKSRRPKLRSYEDHPVGITLPQAEEEMMAKQALDLLDEKERAVVILYFVWGFSLMEIGHVFGVTESRISGYLTAVLKKVKALSLDLPLPEER